MGYRRAVSPPVPMPLAQAQGTARAQSPALRAFRDQTTRARARTGRRSGSTSGTTRSTFAGWSAANRRQLPAAMEEYAVVAPGVVTGAEEMHLVTAAGQGGAEAEQ